MRSNRLFKSLTFLVLFLSRKKVQINLLFEACSFVMNILLLLVIIVSSFCLIKKKQKIKPLSMRLLHIGFRFAPCSFSSAACSNSNYYFQFYLFHLNVYFSLGNAFHTFHLSRTKALYSAFTSWRGTKPSSILLRFVYILD